MIAPDCPWEERIATRKQHVERVLASLNSGSEAARSRLSAAWQRSFSSHGLDPAQTGAQTRVTAAQLGARREALERLLRIATPKLEHLFGLIGQSGCGVLLTDADGIVLERRCTDADAAVFRDWGLWPGMDWSEAAQGTNGIGTCLAEKRPVTIHRDQHFLASNIGMSCIDAPIYGHDGALLAALDVSSARADQTETFNRLIAAMVVQTAQQIEVEAFRAAFPDSRVIVADGGGSGAAALLAVDQDDIVIGATRGARKAFGLGATGPIDAVPAADLLGRGDAPSGFEGAERATVIRALARARGNVSEAARALGIGRATLYRRMRRLGVGD